MHSFVKLISSSLLYVMFLNSGHVFADDATLDYHKLREKITFGKATLLEVRQALTEPSVVNLTNTLHALYSMRWH